MSSPSAIETVRRPSFCTMAGDLVVACFVGARATIRFLDDSDTGGTESLGDTTLDLSDFILAMVAAKKEFDVYETGSGMDVDLDANLLLVLVVELLATAVDPIPTSLRADGSAVHPTLPFVWPFHPIEDAADSPGRIATLSVCDSRLPYRLVDASLTDATRRIGAYPSSDRPRHDLLGPSLCDEHLAALGLRSLPRP